ncbi:MAG: hypothetical protein Q8M76_16440, partial [Spirochaetaceae bacterium]|nr:hypothetical protein [Spirochaetaceae bacterium]
MIPRLALLGAVKHYKRSLVVLAAVALSCAVMLFAGSLLGGVTESFYDSVTTMSGHVRIDDERAATALSPLGLTALVADADAVAREAAIAGGPRVLAAEPVLSFGALLLESGIDDSEPRNLAMRGIGVTAGTRFADNVRSGIVSGEFLPGGRGVALSESAARLAGTALGEGIVVLVQDSSGQPWYEELPVTGVFRTESRDFDETTFYMGINKAREMLDVGSSAREVRLLLARRDDARRAAREVGSALNGEGARSRGSLRVMDWMEINASVLSMLAFIKVLMGTLVGLFVVVSGTIIANTVLMSVLERIREFGAMRAIG